MANIKDVARLAGVSISTVSRVVNHSAGVAPQKYQAVQKAMKELHYQPNTFAKALVSNKSNTLGLVVGSLSNPFFGLLMQGVEKVARELDKQLLVSVGHNSADMEKAAIQSIINRRCDALIVHSDYLTDYQLMELLDDQPSAVVINRQIPDIKTRCVFIDNRQLAKSAVNHLFEQGHTDIAGIIPDDGLDETEQRLQGYQDAFAERGIIFDKNKIITTQNSFQGGYNAINQLLDRSISASALFIHSSIMAAGCLKALREHKLLIPSDLSLIAISDGLPAKLLYPELTVMEYPIKKMSEAATLLAINLADEPEAFLSTEFQIVVNSGDSVFKRC